MLQNITKEVEIMFKTASVFIYVSFGFNKTSKTIQTQHLYGG